MTDLAIPKPYQLLLTGVAAIALLTTGLVVGVSQKIGRNVLQPRYFSCEQQADTKQQNIVWTVMYRQPTTELQPWLSILSGVEGDNDLEKRCQQVATTLDSHYSDQLQKLFYQAHSATPDQQAICVQTAKHSPTNCATLLILKPQIAPEQYFADFAAPLAPYYVLEGNQTVIDLKKRLATEAP
ncbi:MAG: COP23 domain-containing protein [Limnothrix sp.]